MGVVSRSPPAQLESSGLALKMVLAEAPTPGPRCPARFHNRELQAVASLKHPDIVQIHDGYRAGGLLHTFV